MDRTEGHGSPLLQTTLAEAGQNLAPASMLYGRELRLKGSLVVGVSQAGASPDIVETIRTAREGGAGGGIRAAAPTR